MINKEQLEQIFFDMNNVEVLALIKFLTNNTLNSIETLEQNEEVDFEDDSAKLSIGYDKEGEEHFMTVDEFRTLCSTFDTLSQILERGKTDNWFDEVADDE